MNNKIDTHWSNSLVPDYSATVLPIDIKRKSRLLVPTTSAASSSRAFLQQPLAVLTKQTMQAVSGINQPIFLRCLWF